MHKAVEAAIEAADGDAIKTAYAGLHEKNEAHLKHEESVMMPKVPDRLTRSIHEVNAYNPLYIDTGAPSLTLLIKLLWSSCRRRSWRL